MPGQGHTSGQGQMPGQWSSNLAPSTPRGVGIRTAPNTAAVPRGGCPIVCQRGVGSRFTPRPNVTCVRGPSAEDQAVTKESAMRDTMHSQVMETPPTSMRKHLEVWSSGAKPSRPGNRKARSLSSDGNAQRQPCHPNKGAKYQDVPVQSRPASPRKHQAPGGYPSSTVPSQVPRIVRWDQALQQETLEDRVHMLEQKIRELTTTGMSKFEECRPEKPNDQLTEHGSEERCEHFLQQSPMSSPTFDRLDFVDTSTPSFEQLQVTSGLHVRKREQSKASHPVEASMDRSIDLSPVSPAPSCMITSPDAGSSSRQPFRRLEFQADDDKNSPVASGLIAEVEVLKAQVANLSLELTECKQSKVQVEKTFRDTMDEYKRSMETLRLQLEKAEGHPTRTHGHHNQRRSCSTGMRTPRTLGSMLHRPDVSCDSQRYPRG